MIAYHCKGPEGTRFEGVHLRLVAYTPQHAADPTRLKCILQVVPGSSPMAEFPLMEEFLTPLELAVVLSESLKDGWRLEFDQQLAKTLDRQYLTARPKIRVRLFGRAS